MHFNVCFIYLIQEAQLPQRNSASAAYMEQGGGLGPPAHFPATPSDFGTNRKRVCDFLLVGHCDYGPILHRF